MKVKKYTVKQIGKVVTGKTPSTLDNTNFGNKYLFITPTELGKGNTIIKSTSRMLSQKGFDSIKTNTISDVSVLVGCIGWDMGNIGLSFETCATNQQINSISQFNNFVNPLFVYYWFLTKKEYLFSIAGVTRTPILKKSTFEDIEIPLPPLTEQTKIADVLYALDSKIELNNKINTTLENMAQTLYNYWFTQFDFPDENGKPYKSSGGKMVYNDELKREIPEGWEVVSLADVTNMYQPETLSTKDLIPNGKYFVFGAGGILGKYDKFNHNESEITITCRGNGSGNVFYTLPRTWITGNSMVVTPLNSLVSKEYLYYYLQFNGIHRFITGSAQPQITRQNLSLLQVCLPSKDVLSMYNKMTQPIFNQIKNNQLENEELTQIRDFLLPLLMSGQVRVE